MKLSYILRRAPRAPTLRERAEALRASLTRQDPGAEQGVAPHAGQLAEPPATVELDPALTAAADYRTAWDAAEVAAQVTGDVPDDEAETMVQAYDRLRAVRPTTTAGFRALAEAWAIALNGERGAEPSLYLADHAADSLIAGAGVCVPTPVTDDAELLHLGAQLDAAHSEWRAAVEANREPDGRLHRALSEARSRGGPTALELRAAWEQPGVGEAHEAEERAFDNLHPICEAIWQTPACTPAGLAVKARAALVHIWPRGQFEADAALGDEEGLSKESARRLIEACCATAGVNWKGEPLDGRPAAVESTDPVLVAIKAHKAAYTEYARRADVWNGMLPHDTGYAEAKAATAIPSRREIETYEALFDLRPVTLSDTKALAEYLLFAVRQASVDESPSDGERALRVVAEALARLPSNPPQADPSNPGASVLISAIEAEWAVWATFDGADTCDGDPAFEACLARRQALLSAADALPADSTATRHAKALALAWLEYTDIWERGRRYEDYGTDGRLALAIHAAFAGTPQAVGPKLKPPSLAGMVDFASASMDELRALHDTANEVGSFAYALTWSGRCRDGTLPSRSMPGDGLNAVGTLMLWLGDALAGVEAAALDEVKRRAPKDATDRSTRLELMARPNLENDDPDQIEAFGRELLAHAAAERTRS